VCLWDFNRKGIGKFVGPTPTISKFKPIYRGVVIGRLLLPEDEWMHPDPS
jgi:hypothetical protein